jgi:hypothetical protein
VTRRSSVRLSASGEGESFTREAFADEGVDGIAKGSVRVGRHLRNGWPLDGLVGPVPFVHGAFCTQRRMVSFLRGVRSL